MTSELHTLLDSCLNEATEEEAEFLKNILNGMHLNQTSGIGMISGVLQMERTMDENSCIITIPLAPIALNSLGIAHGGITATLIDSTMGSLANYLAPEGKAVVTTQLNINYLAPGTGEKLTCVAQTEHKGNNTMVMSATVYRSDGKKMAKATGSFFIINKQ